MAKILLTDSRVNSLHVAEAVWKFGLHGEAKHWYNFCCLLSGVSPKYYTSPEVEIQPIETPSAEAPFNTGHYMDKESVIPQYTGNTNEPIVIQRYVGNTMEAPTVGHHYAGWLQCLNFTLIRYL